MLQLVNVKVEIWIMLFLFKYMTLIEKGHKMLICCSQLSVR